MSLVLQDVSLSIADKPLLSHISIAVAPGEMAAIIGANGAGKSSLLHAIMGDIPYTGHISLNNQQMQAHPKQTLARQIAILPQVNRLNFPFTVEEVVALGRIPHSSGLSRDTEIVAHCLTLLDLTHLAQQSYLALSGGEQQRTQLARVLAQIYPTDDESKTVLLDEPCQGLDPGHQQLMMSALQQLAGQQIGVLMVQHDVNFAAHYADKLIAIAEGGIYAEGSPGDILSPELMQVLYGVSATRIAHPDTGKPMILEHRA